MFTNLAYKVRKAIFRPFWKIRDWLKKHFCEFIEVRYNPKQYWKKRHKKYGLDLRGVGNCSLSAEENMEIYEQARKIFERVCEKEGVDFKKAKMLDIGCGTGFYAEIFRSHGGTDYLGIDITDQLFPELKREFPLFKFKKRDITKEPIHEKFDLVIMIDVTQHIVDDQRFSFAMRTVKSCLSEKGVFVVTSWLSDRFKKRRPYEVERPIDYYRREFQGTFFSDPIPFRDKYVFTIRSNAKDL
jgi:SAM-dependent methyltransferase